MHKVSECIDHLYETNDGFRAALDKSKSSHQGIVGEVKWPRAEFLRKALQIFTADLTPSGWKTMRSGWQDANVSQEVTTVWSTDLFDPALAELTSKSVDEAANKEFIKAMGQRPTNAKYVCMLMDLLTDACVNAEVTAPTAFDQAHVEVSGIRNELAKQSARI